MGLEPTHLSIPEPKSGAATNYAKGANLLLNICMTTANTNLGIEALLKHASASTFKNLPSWTNAKEFVPAPWLQNPKPEFKPTTWWQRLDSNQPHTDFQSAALPDELRRQ